MELNPYYSSVGYTIPLTRGTSEPSVYPLPWLFTWTTSGSTAATIVFRYSFLEWLENINYDLRVHSLQDGGGIVRVELIAG